MFEASRGAPLLAPALANSSCAALGGPRWPAPPAAEDALRALFVFALSAAIVLGNLVLICVLNSRRYGKYVDSQPRYLLTSLALNDLLTGVLVAPAALLPALYRCWPYGEIFCQIQALLRGAVSQQSAVILVCMAIDRYLFLLHPAAYRRHSSKKGCVLVISVTWILSVSLFAALVLPRSGYYFNATGLMACDVFHSRVAFRILSCCAYYFPTTMALMYCYGSGFHAGRGASKCEPRAGAEAGREPHEVVGGPQLSASRTMAAMSLGFIVVVTPATVQEVVAACTGCKVPPTLDFLVTWLALSDSFWNPFLYWLLNSHFRRISHELVRRYMCCRRTKPFESRGRAAGCCGSSVASEGPLAKGEAEGLGEKFWGEILERTVSSSSLHALQACRRAGCAGAPRAPPLCAAARPCSGRCRPQGPAPRDFCAFAFAPDFECARSRSYLSLDERDFGRTCDGGPDS